jgi:hypothetical protein
VIAMSISAVELYEKTGTDHSVNTLVPNVNKLGLKFGRGVVSIILGSVVSEYYSCEKGLEDKLFVDLDGKKWIPLSYVSEYQAITEADKVTFHWAIKECERLDFIEIDGHTEPNRVLVTPLEKSFDLEIYRR